MGMVSSMNDKVTGIILKQSDYKDHSVLLSVLTREYGKVSFVASGARKITSKNAMNILPYTKSEFIFDYKEGKTIFRLKSATTIQLHRGLHEDLMRSSIAAILSEIADVFTYQSDDYGLAQRLYDLLDQGLTMLETETNSQLVLALFLSEVASLGGVSPNVDECVICGSTKVVGISVADGGFVCERCLPSTQATRYTPEQLKQFRLLTKAKLEHYSIVLELVDNCMHDIQLFVDFLETFFGIKIRAFPFYKRLLTIE